MKCLDKPEIESLVFAQVEVRLSADIFAGSFDYFGPSNSPFMITVVPEFNIA